MPDLTYLTRSDPHRFDLSDDRASMKAVVTIGNGGYDRLDYRDVPRPEIGPGELLLKVLGTPCSIETIAADCTLVISQSFLGVPK